MSTGKIRIQLDWSQLLGFDQLPRPAAGGAGDRTHLAKVGNGKVAGASRMSMVGASKLTLAAIAKVGVVKEI
jgi:hypothetical protein